MRFYLAGKYSMRSELLEYAMVLSFMGHSVVSRWVYGNHENVTCNNAVNSVYAAEDLFDIASCDAFVLFVDPAAAYAAAAKTLTRGGHHVELGFVMGLNYQPGANRRIFIVGQRQNVFHCLKSVSHFKNWSDLRDYIQRFTV